MKTVTKVEPGDSWTMDGVKYTVKSIYLERWTSRDAFHTSVLIARETDAAYEELRTSVDDLTRWLEIVRERELKESTPVRIPKR